MGRSGMYPKLTLENSRKLSLMWVGREGEEGKGRGLTGGVMLGRWEESSNMLSMSDMARRSSLLKGGVENDFFFFFFLFQYL